MLRSVMDQVSVASHHSFEDEIDEEELEGPDCKAVFKENLKKVLYTFDFVAIIAVVIRCHSIVHLHILHLGLRRGVAEGQRVPLDPGV